MKIALGKSQSHCEQLIEEIYKHPAVLKDIQKDLLVVGKGGNITLEEKLLLKDWGELTKYSFTPQNLGTEKRTPRSPRSQEINSPKVYEAKPRAFVEYITELRLSKDDFGSELERYLGKQESRFQNVIKSIKALLEKEKVKNRKLSTNLAKKETGSVKNEMLGLFNGNIDKQTASKKKIKTFSMSSKLLFTL